MIQDIHPHRFDNRFIPDRKPSPDSIVLLFREEEVLLRKSENDTGENDDTLSPYTYADLCAVLPHITTYPVFYLFALDDTAWYLIYEKDADFPGSLFYPVTRLRREHILPRHFIFAVLTAEHLNRWYHENRYCGTCAHETVHAPDERAMECPACKRRIYPKIMPAVIVAITNGDEIVLTRYANRPFAYHALVAGFNEIGETFEDTVRREVMEEVGLRVKNIRYYKSQPWAVAGDILAGYFCDVDGDPTIRMDEQELKEAIWVRREDVDGQPDDFSLTNEMMMLFKAGNEPR